MEEVKDERKEMKMSFCSCRHAGRGTLANRSGVGKKENKMAKRNIFKY